MTDTDFPFGPDIARRGISDAADTIDDLEHAGTHTREFADAVAVLDALRWIKAAADTAFKTVEAHALTIMGEKKLELPGYGIVEAKRVTKRTDWEHDDLFRAVLDARPVNPETGELAPDETPAERIRRVYGCKGYSASITALRALGLNPGEFCHEDEQGWSLKLPGAATRT